ncbi:hypothetical protein DFH27DRAFT_561680 [Peziza echinospora]|nr:hypothetical protein DFH27DRAFT_561680 [Peziza echinospora]
MSFVLFRPELGLCISAVLQWKKAEGAGVSYSRPMRAGCDVNLHLWECWSSLGVRSDGGVRQWAESVRTRWLSLVGVFLNDDIDGDDGFWGSSGLGRLLFWV